MEDESNTTNSNGGRPIGSTNKNIQLSLDLKDRAKDEMAILYDKQKNKMVDLLNGAASKKYTSLLFKSSVLWTLALRSASSLYKVASIAIP